MLHFHAEQHIVVHFDGAMLNIYSLMNLLNARVTGVNQRNSGKFNDPFLGYSFLQKFGDVF